ncbi:hypothetical protein Pcac1_g10253 [Phytophthora cactorum]|nr:hypothetical protein Pcac1_g10253 [Phytophthora cactorum]
MCALDPVGGGNVVVVLTPGSVKVGESATSTRSFWNSSSNAICITSRSRSDRSLASKEPAVTPASCSRRSVSFAVSNLFVATGGGVTGPSANRAICGCKTFVTGFLARNGWSSFRFQLTFGPSRYDIVAALGVRVSWDLELLPRRLGLLLL